MWLGVLVWFELGLNLEVWCLAFTMIFTPSLLGSLLFVFFFSSEDDSLCCRRFSIGGTKWTKSRDYSTKKAEWKALALHELTIVTLERSAVTRSRQRRVLA